MVISSKLLIDIKRHLRIFHDTDDNLIKNEIEVAIFNIYTQYLRTTIPTNAEIEKGFDPRILLAIKHLVTIYRNNPDGVQIISGNVKILNDRLIQRSLGKLFIHGGF